MPSPQPGSILQMCLPQAPSSGDPSTSHLKVARAQGYSLSYPLVTPPRSSPGEGLSGWGRPPPATPPSLGASLLSEGLSWVWEKSCRTKPGGKLPSVKCRTSVGAVKVSVGESGDGGSRREGREAV